MLILDLPSELAGHVSTAVAMHQRWLRGVGLREPDGLAELQEILRVGARRGQAGTGLEDLWELAQAAVVTPRLLTYAQAATALSCSTRQVKRLVAGGALPSLKVGPGTVRIAVSALDAYVDGLTRTSTEDAA